MKPYKRRAAGKPDYYKVATWDAKKKCWVDGKKQFDTREEAEEWILKHNGEFRISFVNGHGARIDHLFRYQGGVQC